MSDELHVAMVTTSLDDDEDLPEGPCVVLRGSIAAVKEAAKLFDQPVRVVPAPAVPDDVAERIAELLWHRFAPSHEVEWPPFDAAEYRGVAADVIAALTHPTGEPK